MSRIALGALEINAALHCNLSCRGCSHASPAAAHWFADPAIVERDLRALSRVTTVRTVRVLGGEPLLHPDLTGVLRAVHDSGIGARTRVVTNGVRLHLTDWEWLAHADEVHVSIYPGTAVREKALAELERRCRRDHRDLLVKRYHAFRLVHPVTPLKPAEAQAVFDTCQSVHAWSCHSVHDGAVYLCPVSAPPYAVVEDERCLIEPLATLRPRLEAFLRRDRPLAACANCLGTVGALVPHTQVPTGAWSAASHAGVIDRRHLAVLQADPFANLDCATVQIDVRTGNDPERPLPSAGRARSRVRALSRLTHLGSR